MQTSSEQSSNLNEIYRVYGKGENVLQMEAKLSQLLHLPLNPIGIVTCMNNRSVHERHGDRVQFIAPHRQCSQSNAELLHESI
jgi:hypothetical protein